MAVSKIYMPRDIVLFRESAARIRDCFPSGSIVYTVTKHTTAAGVKTIDLYAAKEGVVVSMYRDVARLLNLKINDERRGLVYHNHAELVVRLMAMSLYGQPNLLVHHEL